MQLGLCCISEELSADKVRFQTMTFKTYKKLEPAARDALLASKYKNNLEVLLKTIQHCANNGWCYRVPSSLFPLLTLPEAGVSWSKLSTMEPLDDLFESAKKVVSEKVRLSSHPDQFNVLASIDPDTVDRTVKELEHAAWILDRLGAPQNYNSPINLHIGSNYGGPVEIAARLQESFNRLSDSVRSRLVFEVEDKGIWTCEALIKHVHGSIRTPITFDYLHHACNPGTLTQEQAFRACHATWPVKPLFHYSEGIPGAKNPRKHAEYAARSPEIYDLDVDLDVELKAKDLAIRELAVQLKHVTV